MSQPVRGDDIYDRDAESLMRYFDNMDDRWFKNQTGDTLARLEVYFAGFTEKAVKHVRIKRQQSAGGHKGAAIRFGVK